MYSRRDLNPHAHNGHRILSPACLPIPPLEHASTVLSTSTWYIFGLERKTGPDSYRDEPLSALSALSADRQARPWSLFLSKVLYSLKAMTCQMLSERRDLNPRPSPWQGDALPLSYFRMLAIICMNVCLNCEPA